MTASPVSAEQKFQSVFATPSDSSLEVDPLQIANHKHSELDAGRDRGTPAALIMRLAHLLDEQVEPVFREKPIELVVKDMSRTRRKTARLQPKLPLNL